MRIRTLLLVGLPCALALLAAACSAGSESRAVSVVCRPPCSGTSSCINGRCVENDGDTTDGDGNDLDTSDRDGADSDVDAETPQESESLENEAEMESAEADSEPDFDLPPIDGDFDFALQPCDVLGTISDPELTPLPKALDFGALAIGEMKTSLLQACNTGNADLHLTALQFSPETSREFLKNAPPLPLTIPSGKAAPIYLTYRPLDQTADSGKLLLLSNDPAHSTVEVPLLSAVKSEPLVWVTPEVLQFPGTTAIGESVVRRVTFTNVGRVPTSIQRITLQNGGAFTLDAFSNPDGPLSNQGPWSLAAGGKLFLDVRMTMSASPPSADTISAVWTHPNGARTLSVKLEVSDASICAIPAAGPDQTVSPLDTVKLDGSASRDPNATSVLAYKWSWLEKPENASRAVLLDEADNPIEDTWTTSATPHFFAIQAGTYKIRLTLQDVDKDCTEAKSDDVVIFVVPDETIHLQLNWSKPSNDHDLHLIAPGGHHSRECGRVKNNTDCCYSNCSTGMGTNTNCPPRGCPGPLEAPDWGAQGARDDDPTLDIDDRSGKGPENINLSLPIKGDYLVTVENYNGTESLAITVKVYLFGSLAQTFRYGPPFTDNRLPAGYHWNVCKLRVIDESHIEVVPIGTMEISPENQ